MPVSAEKFLEQLSTVRLLSTEELSTIRGKLGEQKLKADAEQLARELVKAGKLTRYQAAALYQGRGRGLVFGEYVVLDKLGAGGMGQVFKAQHRRMKRMAAIKVLPPHMMKAPQIIQRFYQEVEVAAKLNHPNIVQAYDAAEANGLHFLVMEFVDGQDLGSIVSKRGPLSVEQAMNCLRQTAEGLAYAHGQGIIHRDIKPANLLADRQGNVKILDMGLARTVDALNPRDSQSGEGLTQQGEFMGTVDYMAPEQARDARAADHRADIYSLGCTLYRLLTGELPFPGDTTVKKLMAHMTAPIPPLRKARPEAPPRLDELYQRMMTKDPDERINSAQEIAATLKELLNSTTEEKSSISVLDDPQQSEEWHSFLQATDAAASSTKLKRKRPEKETAAVPVGTNSKMPLVLAAGGALVLLILLVAGWLALRGGSDKPEVAQTPKTAEPESGGFSSGFQTPPTEAESSTKPSTATTSKSETKPKTQTASTEAKPTAVTPIVVSQLPLTAGKPIDLLPLIDLKRDVIEGSWEFAAPSVLRVNALSGTPRIRMPIDVGGHYALDMVAMRTDGTGALNLVILAGERQVGVYIDLDGTCGIGFIDAKRADQNETTVTGNEAPRFAPNVRRNIRCEVLKDNINVIIDGRTVINWKGSYDRLSLAPILQTVNPRSIAIAARPNSVFEITKLVLAPLDGSTPAPTSVAGTNPSPGKPVDLLPLIDLKRDVVEGSWEIPKPGVLRVNVASGSSYPRLQIPIEVPPSYTLTVVATRIGGNQGLFLGILAGGRQGLVSMASSGVSVIGMIDGQSVDKNETKVSGSSVPQFESGKPLEIRYAVMNEGIVVQVDRRTIVDWKGPYERLSLNPLWHIPDSRAILIGTVSGTSFEITKLELTPLDGSSPAPTTVATTNAPTTTPATQTAPAAPKDTRLPVPSTELVQQAIAEIREVYATEYKQAKATAEKGNLAAKLLTQASDASTTPVVRYALMLESLVLASEAADAQQITRIAKETADLYRVEALDLATDAFEDAAEKASLAPLNHSLATAAVLRVHEAIALDRFEFAKRLSAVSTTAARKSRDAQLVKLVGERAKQVSLLESRWQEAKAARVMLADSSDDRAANSTVGRYLCFALGDVDGGLAYLAKGDDLTLAELAEKSLKRVSEPAERQALADAWYDAAQAAKGPQKSELQGVAYKYYLRVWPIVSGIAKTKVEQRLTQLGGVTRPLTIWQAYRERRAAQWALSSRGQVSVLVMGGKAEQSIGLEAALPPQDFVVTRIAIDELKYKGDPGFKGITNSGASCLDGLVSLQRLSLRYTLLSDAGLAHIRDLTSLSHLDINAADVTNAGCDTIQNLRALTNLNLRQTQVLDGGFQKLQVLTELNQIGLEARLTDVGLQYLKAFPKLAKLDLSYCKLTDAGLRQLYPLKTLQTLSLGEVKVSPPALQQLKTALPGCKISP